MLSKEEYCWEAETCTNSETVIGLVPVKCATSRLPSEVTKGSSVAEVDIPGPEHPETTTINDIIVNNIKKFLILNCQSFDSINHQKLDNVSKGVHIKVKSDLKLTPCS